MHIEKIIFDNIFNTVMNLSGKTKDNEKSQMDLSLYYRQKDLELKSHPNGKMFKPTTKLHTCKIIDLGYKYSSNLATCVDFNRRMVLGMKSHDCHVFTECLLPISFSLLPSHVLNIITEVSHFFKKCVFYNFEGR